MYTTYFNQTMIDKKALLLKNIPLDYDYPEQGSWFDLDYTPGPDNSQMTHRFNKSGITAGLSNLTRVYFIVSSSTASASELAINNLKPYLQVILIGAALADDGDRTFGKPVGFFEIRFGDYSLFMPNFETKNARNEGAYYTGIPTDIKMFDDLADDFGNPEEACFAAAIANINNTALSSKEYSKSEINPYFKKSRNIGPESLSDIMVLKFSPLKK